MPISVLSDISAALDDQTLQRLAEKFDTPALQVRYGIDLASRHILENLVKHSESLEGAQAVYKQVAQFKGSILSDIRGNVEFDDTVNKGTQAIATLVGSEFDEMVESVQTSSDASPLAAAKIVGLASALTLDAAGVRKVEFDLNRNALTDFLRTQAGVSGEPPMRTTESQLLDNTASMPLDPDRIFPSTMTAPMDSPIAQQPASEPAPVASAPAFAETTNTTDPALTPDTATAPTPDATPEPAAPLSKLSALQQLNLAPKPDKPKEPLKARKTTPIDSSGEEGDKPLSPLMKVFTIAAPLLVILGTTLYAWRIIDSHSTAIERLLVSATASETETETEIAAAPEDETLATSNDKEAPQQPSPKFTKTISIETQPTELFSRPFRRYESSVHDEIAKVFDSSILQKESTQQYSWDKNRAIQPDKGKILAGPWQVTSKPRNSTKQSYFTYK